MAKTSQTLIDSTVVAMVVVVMVVIAALIVGTLTSNSVFNDITASGSVTNETGAYINSTGYTLGQASVSGFTSPAITAAFNATDNSSIGTGNITVSGAGVVTNATATEWNDVIISYTYTYSTGRNLAGVNITEVSNNFGSFVTNLIAFLAVMGTILGVVWLVLYVRRLFNKKEGLQGITA